MTSEVNGSGIGSRFPNPTASSVSGDANEYINQLFSRSLDGSGGPADKFEKKQGEAKHEEPSSPWKTAGKWLLGALAVVGAWKMGGGTIIRTAFNSIFRREENASFRSLFQGWGRQGEREGSVLSAEKRSEIHEWVPPPGSRGSSVMDETEPIQRVERDISEKAESEAGKDITEESIKGAESEAGKKARRNSTTTTEKGSVADGGMTPGTKLTPPSTSKASSVADETPAIPTGPVDGLPVRKLEDVIKSASRNDKEFLQQGLTRYKDASTTLQKTKAAQGELLAKQEDTVLEAKEKSALIQYEKLISQQEMALEQLTDIASKAGISKTELGHWSGVEH
jgi:hypothetical protein